MTSAYLHQFSASPLKGALDHQNLPLSTPEFDASSFPCTLLHTQFREANDGRDHHPQRQQQQEQKEHLSVSGSDVHLLPFPITNNKCVPTQYLPEQYHKAEDVQQSAKWMPSKIRLMKRMLRSDKISPDAARRRTEATQDHPQTNQGNKRSSRRASSLPEGIVRVCSDCSTTKTPLWRSGPQGPKSLCNACGIRQRKARRRAAAALGSAVVPANPHSKLQKMKRSDRDCIVPFKKRLKVATTETKKISFNETTIKLSKNPSLHQVFPQDEKDAAILLMALSCGLLQS